VRVWGGRAGSVFSNAGCRRQLAAEASTPNLGNTRAEVPLVALACLSQHARV